MANTEKKRHILMIAYHFPPLAGSSGIQRTLQFVRYLPEFGWQPIVLTTHPRAYPRTSDDQLQDIPAGVTVIRAPAFDSARHFALAGRYPSFIARPDRWISWLPGATLMGKRIIRQYRPQCIWSTYPIATAHRIGYALKHISGLPWIADFRDPMAQDDYPADPATWASFKRIEELVFANARGVVFTTPSALAHYRARYPQMPTDRLRLIENGYTEDSFLGLEADARTLGPLNPGRFTLLHSGIVYASERDPTHLFAALQRMVQQHHIDPAHFLLRLRAHNNSAYLQSLIKRYQLQTMIQLADPLPYRCALVEMLRADGLLILQASDCNQQIPAKLYEYLRTKRPVLALTDPLGDTAAALHSMGYHHQAPLNDSARIAQALQHFISTVNSGQITEPNPDIIHQHSRRYRTQQFVDWLNSIQ